MPQSPVRFVLVGTRTPGNLGAVCRVAAAFGFPSVRMVRPQFELPQDEARWLAHGAEDVLRDVTIHDDLADALRGCFRSAATTARPRNWRRPVRTPGEAALSVAQARPERPFGIVFGPEDRGLTNEDLSLCDEVLSIPLPPGRSATLSLPASATLVAWELARCGDSPDTAAAGAAPDAAESADVALATADLDSLLDDIHETLDGIGFRPRPDATRWRGSLRDFIARAQPTEGDRRLLRHLFAQIGKWRRRVRSEAKRGLLS